jgi:hypothetical protein
MEYELISQATGETLHLTAREWEMLRRLAAQPAGWEPNEQRNYTQGSISAEEGLAMAESVKELFPYLSKERPGEQTEKPHTLAELRERFGGIEGDPFTYLGNAAGCHKVEAFVKLATAGGFEVHPRRFE